MADPELGGSCLRPHRVLSLSFPPREESGRPRSWTGSRCHPCLWWIRGRSWALPTVPGSRERRPESAGRPGAPDSGQAASAGVAPCLSLAEQRLDSQVVDGIQASARGLGGSVVLHSLFCFGSAACSACSPVLGGLQAPQVRPTVWEVLEVLQLGKAEPAQGSGVSCPASPVFPAGGGGS